MRICSVDHEDLMEMLCEIRALNPKPGAAYGGGAVQPVVPDVFVRAAPDGGWHIEINSDTIPRVLVNSRYYATVRKSFTGKDEKTYLSDCLHSANWLVKALDQRARTILKVATEIVRLQDSFLRYGISQLRPLNLRMVAEAIGMHESTVSRVTANKYMATPRGVLDMRYFFSSAVGAGEEGDAHAAEAVRHRIRRLIEEEKPAHVLSDDKLVELLHAEGIEVARRTVAKYREAMNIPSSVQRRRLKRVLLP
jgi:RNA polymerase sigma-54 factor